MAIRPRRLAIVVLPNHGHVAAVRVRAYRRHPTWKLRQEARLSPDIDVDSPCRRPFAPASHSGVGLRVGYDRQVTPVALPSGVQHFPPWIGHPARLAPAEHGDPNARQLVA